MNQRSLWPGLGIVVGAGLGLLVAILFFDDQIALSAAIGAGIGIVVGAVATQLYASRESSDAPPDSSNPRDRQG